MRQIANTLMGTGIFGLFIGAAAADGTALPLVVAVIAASAALMIIGRILSPEM